MPVENDYDDDESVVESQHSDDDNEPDDISELNDESSYGSDSYAGSYEIKQKTGGAGDVKNPLGSSAASSLSRHSSQYTEGVSSYEENNNRYNGQRALSTIDEQSERSGIERDEESEESSEEQSEEDSDSEVRMGYISVIVNTSNSSSIFNPIKMYHSDDGVNISPKG